MGNLAVVVDDISDETIKQEYILLKRVIRLEDEARILYNLLVSSSYLIRSRLYEESLRNQGFIARKSIVKKSIAEDIVKDSSESCSFLQSKKNSFSSTRLTYELQKKVIHYLPLVHIIACSKIKSLPKNIQLDDLISDGVLGLIDGVKKLDESLNASIDDPAPYLKIRILGAIRDGLRKLDYHSKTTRKMETAYERVLLSFQENGINPTPEEIAQKMNISLQRYEEFRQLFNRKLCYSEDLAIARNDGTKLDFFAAYQSLIESAVETDIDKNKKLISVAYTVSKLESTVQKEVFVDLAIHQLQNKDVAKKFDIEHARVSQLWAKTIHYLQKMVPIYMSNYRFVL